MAVCKINVDSDLRLAMTAGIRKHFAENPTHFDPRQYLGEGRDFITQVVKHKIETVLGSAPTACNKPRRRKERNGRVQADPSAPSLHARI